MIVKFNDKSLTVLDAPKEEDSFVFIIRYDVENETILNKPINPLAGQRHDAGRF